MKYLVIFALSSLLACSDSNNLTISVTDSDDAYEFYAKFDKQKTQRVQDFINTKIAPSSSVTGDDIDITTTLNDKTQFKLEEYPGKVRIKLDKDENSKASYQRVKAMCEGLKQVIEAK
jgi:hypothetical protein